MKLKFILSNVALSAFLLLAVVSCKKDENKVTYEGGTPPALAASRTGSIPLSFANKDVEGLKLTWSNPDYQFTTGVSSQNVNYLIEIDTTGANFTNPKRQSITIANEMVRSFTVGEFNDFLLNQLQLDTVNTHNIEIRVKSYLTSGAAPLFSNVLKFTAKPYPIPPKVTPPASGKLYIVGDATGGGWNNPVPVPAQEFTKVSNTVYTINVQINGGASYLFLPVNGDWSAKFGCIGGNNSNNPDGDDFRANGGDFRAPAVSGLYKIEVDFQRGKFTATKI